MENKNAIIFCQMQMACAIESYLKEHFLIMEQAKNVHVTNVSWNEHETNFVIGIISDTLKVDPQLEL